MRRRRAEAFGIDDWSIGEGRDDQPWRGQEKRTYGGEDESCDGTDPRRKRSLAEDDGYGGGTEHGGVKKTTWYHELKTERVLERGYAETK